MLSTNTTIGHQALTDRGLDFSGYFFWIALGSLFGFILFFNLGFILALSFLDGNFIFPDKTSSGEVSVLCLPKILKYSIQLLALVLLYQEKSCQKIKDVKTSRTPHLMKRVPKTEARNYVEQ